MGKRITTGARLADCRAVADKHTQEKLKRLSDTIDMMRAERDQARADLADVKAGMWKVLEMPDFGPEELAVGLALVANIVKGWPRAYTPHVPTLAATAHVDDSTVNVTLDALTDAGVLHTPGSS